MVATSEDPPPARASRASRSRSSQAGLLPLTRTVSSARVRPDILAPRDRPPRGDLRRAREKPAGEESRHARGRRACRCSASRRTARFSSRRVARRPDSRAHLPSEASGSRARDARYPSKTSDYTFPRSFHARGASASTRLHTPVATPSVVRSPPRRQTETTSTIQPRRFGPSDPHRAGRLVTSRRDSPTPRLRRPTLSRPTLRPARRFRRSSSIHPDRGNHPPCARTFSPRRSPSPSPSRPRRRRRRRSRHGRRSSPRAPCFRSPSRSNPPMTTTRANPRRTRTAAGAVSKRENSP